MVKRKQNHNSEPQSDTWDGHVNKAGFSVLHQPNVAIPFTRTGKSQRIAPDILKWDFATNPSKHDLPSIEQKKKNIKVVTL